MRRKFCCEASRGQYEDYYLQQGRGVPIFQGSRGQRGHGLGSMLSGLFRSALPMIKSGLASFGKQALRTGAQIVGDVADGQGFSESAQKRLREGIKSFVSPYSGSVQSGGGRRRKRSKRKLKASKKSKASKKRKISDIFK
jgi:hypothetical protein